MVRALGYPVVESVSQSHRARLEMLKAWAAHDAATFRGFVQTVGRFGVDVQTARVLDLGCGANAPMSVMLHSSGARVTGVDHYLGQRWGLGFRPSRYVSYFREAGLARTARKFFGECVYDRTYYSSLRESVGFDLGERGLDLRAMDVTRLDFGDATFDVVHSNATWEHVPDVAQANRELARVLRPGGLAYIEIHLFPSLSGGHDLPWIVPGRITLGDIKPWRHLRDPEWQAPVYLNRHRERDYATMFRTTAGLEVVDWITEYTEGAELLTDEIRRELAQFSEEDLTRRSIIVVVRKASSTDRGSAPASVN